MVQDVSIRHRRLGENLMSDVEAPDPLREHISALADGDPVPQREALLARLRRDPQARAIWREYHQIGDLMRSPTLLPLPDEEGFTQRVAQRIRCEPLPTAAASGGLLRGPWRWGLAGMLAAGVVAVTVVVTEMSSSRSPQFAAAAGRSSTCAAAGTAPARDAWRDYVASRHLDPGYLASDPLSQVRAPQFATLH